MQKNGGKCILDAEMESQAWRLCVIENQSRIGAEPQRKIEPAEIHPIMNLADKTPPLSTIWHCRCTYLLRGVVGSDYQIGCRTKTL